MTDESTEKQAGCGAAGKSYQLGDIGAHARVAIGENIAWSEGLSRYPGGDEPTGQLSALLERIASDPELGEPERTLATARTEAVAPPCLARRRSLSDSRRRCWTPGLLEVIRGLGLGGSALGTGQRG